MGAGASSTGAMERLPDPIDEATVISLDTTRSIVVSIDQRSILSAPFGAALRPTVHLVHRIALCCMLATFFGDHLTLTGETITGGTGSVAKDTFITTITVRNHTPSLRAWLEFWRIDELTEILEELGMCERLSLY